MACGHAWQAIHHIETRAHNMLSKEAWVKRGGMSRVTVSAVHQSSSVEGESGRSAHRQRFDQAVLKFEVLEELLDPDSDELARRRVAFVHR
jgi:hypothetical protein